MGEFKVKFRFAASALLICGSVLALPAMAADVTISGDEVTFDTKGAVELTVTGPDGYYHKETFKGGHAAVWMAAGIDGSPLADGRYSYQIVELADQRLKRDQDSENLAAHKRGDVYSGAVTVFGGSLVDRDLQESPITKDIVHLDDVIATFSLCVGNDCVNGESFGFDTVRLKENNVRIHFDDTSTTASFPSNDWRIVINDSSNGGSNYWAVEDSTAGRQIFRVDAGAPANSLRVDSAGDVGIGTATPVVDAHIVSGNTPTLRLEQNGSSGFTAQTWDLAGNEANFFIRDATNGSKLSFRIEPSAPQDSIFIQANGDIGIGTNAPDSDLHVRNTAAGDNAELQLEAAGQEWILRATANTGQLLVVNNNTGSQAFRIDDAASSASGTDPLVAIGLTTTNTADADRVTINGELDVLTAITLNGGPVPDYVFESDYELESIEDHAAYMWSEKHLPAIPPAPEGGSGRIDIGAHQMGMLEELEKAHIYIDQLNTTIKKLQERIEKLEKTAE